MASLFLSEKSLVGPALNSALLGISSLLLLGDGGGEGGDQSSLGFQ